MRTIFYFIVFSCAFLLAGCEEADKKSVAANDTSVPIATNPFMTTNGERITLKANNLTQHQILSAMAKQLGFELEFTAPLDKTISVSVEDVTLREVLQHVLSGSPHSVTLTYEAQVDFFPKSIAIALADKSVAYTPSPTTSSAPAITHYSTTVPSAVSAEQRNQAIKQFQEKALSNNKPIPEPDYLKDMTGTKEDATRVIPILKNPSTSSDDKAAIISMLEDGERADVIAALTVALEDKNPDVVTAAIDAIVFFGDAADIATLTKLRDSTNNDDIRQAADDGITLLE